MRKACLCNSGNSPRDGQGIKRISMPGSGIHPQQPSAEAWCRVGQVPYPDAEHFGRCLQCALTGRRRLSLPANSYPGKKIVRAGGQSSQLFPVGERHQFVQNFLQSLKPACVVPGRAEFVFAAQQVEPVRLTDLRYLVPQLGDAFFDRILHSDKASTNTCANYSPKRLKCVPERLR